MSEALNATATFSLAAATQSGSWGGMVFYLVLFVFVPILLITIGLSVLWNLASYTRFKKYLAYISVTPYYFMVGAVSLFCLLIPFAFLYWGYTQAKKGNTVPLRWVVYIAGGYVVISYIGYLVEKYIIRRVQSFEKELSKKNKKKNPKEKHKQNGY